ncbi:hypothetical protein QTP88_026770 [Uroleucon formosanum]
MCLMRRKIDQDLVAVIITCLPSCHDAVRRDYTTNTHAPKLNSPKEWRWWKVRDSRILNDLDSNPCKLWCACIKDEFIELKDASLCVFVYTYYDYQKRRQQ